MANYSLEADMSKENEITFQDLIEKVKTDLFSPFTGTDKEVKSIYPLFLVESVDLEVSVDIKYDTSAGIKITIPTIAEGSLGAGVGYTTGHKVKITLKPIMTLDEMRVLAKRDQRMWKEIEEASTLSLRKGGTSAGVEE